MQCKVKVTEPLKSEADMLAVCAWEDGKSGLILSPEAEILDRTLRGMLSEVARTEDFEAKPKSTLLIHSHGLLPVKRILLVGMGAPKALTVFTFESVLAVVGRVGKQVAARTVDIALPKEIFDRLGKEEAGEAAAIGMHLGTYVFNRHKSEASQKKEKHIGLVQFLVRPACLSDVARGAARGETVARGVYFARDLVNEPPSLTTPSHLGKVAEKIAASDRSLTALVLGKKDLVSLGMQALLGIARGSSEEPQFIVLSYKGTAKKTVALVGKGITFDTGGLSLKPSEHMETMKMDMAGAAAILGLFSVLPILRPKVNVVGLISATENMPGARAIKPGDIVRAMNGKTIEILNTDAEGRVVLADALSYTFEKVKPDVAIDLATLTGACMVALGEEISGLFSTDQKLAALLMATAEKTGEKLWQLPLAEDYAELLKSTVADVRNISGKRYGGAITAALFLKEFVPEGSSWAHLDIAGPAFAESDSPLNPKGGTGVGVRLLARYLLSQ